MVSESVYKDLNKHNKKLFKELVKLYDQKMYKKALKCCEKVLETQPNHGESNAMKALIFNTIGRKKEANEVINQALMYNFKSFTSWHIKGMISRSDKNFEDAKKCFAQSSKIEDDNQKIFKDLLMLELQVRDFPGAVNSITKLMQKQARNKIYCTCYILANHLAGNYEVSENFIDQNREFMVNKMSRVELNEFCMYEAFLYKCHGKYDQAIKILLDYEKEIVDKNSRLELLAELYIKTDKKEDAKDCYEKLLERNPSCVKFYHGIFKSRGIDLDNLDEAAEEQITEIIKNKIEEHPRLLFLKRFLLKFLNKEEEFRHHFEAYCRHFLEKGIPSLVNDIEKMISTDEVKFKVVKETFEKYLGTIQDDLTIDGEEQDPLQECFLLFFLSQTHFIEGDYVKALEFIDQSIEHTPTFIEAWQFKAKILIGLGDSKAAEVAFKKAMSLDTADRFLNAECAKYVLKNGNQEEANEIMKRWSVDQSSEEISSFDFQNMWYEVESGNAHYAHKRYLEAFQMFYFLERHIITMHQDFYDFHFFTMRKFMMRSYVGITDLQDSLRRNPYVQGTHMLRVLNRFYHKENTENEEEKKEHQSWLEGELENHKDPETDKNNWEEYEEIFDPIEKIADPTGVKALKKIIDNGIVNEAINRWNLNLTYNPTNRELHHQAIKWILRGKKYDGAIKSIRYLNQNHPSWIKTVYSNLRFYLHFESEDVKSKLKEKQATEINSVIQDVFGDQDPKNYFEANTKDKEPQSLCHQRYYIKGVKKLFNETVTKAHAQNVFDVLDDAIKNPEHKKNVYKDLDNVMKIINLVPTELKEELIEIADQVFWKFKENQFPSTTE